MKVFDIKKVTEASQQRIPDKRAGIYDLKWILPHTHTSFTVNSVQA